MWKNWKVSTGKLILNSLTIFTTLQLTKFFKNGDFFNLLTEIIWNSISLKFPSLFSTALSKELYLILAKRIVWCKSFHYVISPLKTCDGILLPVISNLISFFHCCIWFPIIHSLSLPSPKEERGRSLFFLLFYKDFCHPLPMNYFNIVIFCLLLLLWSIISLSSLPS